MNQVFPLIQKLIDSVRTKKIIRFNWILLVLAWGVLAFAILPMSSPAFGATLIVSVYILLLLSWIYFGYQAVRGLKNLKTTSDARARDTSSSTPLNHLIIISLYKEPLEIIEKTLRSLQDQSIAHRLNVTLAFEARTPEVGLKQAFLKSRFDQIFRQLVFTIHPHGIAGEIPGKCSNVNYSARETVQRLGLQTPEQMRSTIVTTCDADNLFHPLHFEELEFAFRTERNPHQCVWQAPLFYDWNPEKSSPFARVTGMNRSIHLLGALIPLQINTMSIQSLSLELLVRGDYYHPSYQMEDILNVARWMTEVRAKVAIRPLRLPLISGPTSGRDLKEEFNEWRLQARRWSIGAAEVFHYFFARIRQVPAASGVAWGTSFVFFYVIYQMVGPLLLFIGGLHAAFESQIVGYEILGLEFSTWTAIMMPAQAAWVVFMHGLQLLWTHKMEIGEPARLKTKLIDFVLTPFVVLGYALVSFLALNELALRGKEVCGHDPSAKEGLAHRLPPVPESSSMRKIQKEIAKPNRSTRRANLVAGVRPALDAKKPK